MKKFMEYNFDIERIVLSCYVGIGNGAPVHKNRPSHGIVFHTDGIRYYTFDQTKTIKICENDILYLPKGSNYIVENEMVGGCYAINFQLFSDNVFSPFKFKAKNSKSFIDLFKDTEQLWRNKPSGYEMKGKAQLYNILFNLRKEYEAGYITKETLSLIKPAVDYIYSEYTNDNIEISHLAKLCNMSEAYFRRIFLKSFGTSPIKFINNLKISRAKELISSNLYTVSQAAACSGFHDDSYFSRKFKEATGISPSEYKNGDVKKF